jgi:ATP-dependent DNA ligase
MRLAVRREAFSHPDWIWELKLDGFRSLARLADDRVDLISRRRNIYKSFAGLRAEIKRALAGHTAVLDGEIVCVDAEAKVDPSSTTSYGGAETQFSTLLTCSGLMALISANVR